MPTNRRSFDSSRSSLNNCILEESRKVPFDACDSVIFDHFKQAISNALREIGCENEAEKVLKYTGLLDLIPILAEKFDESSPFDLHHSFNELSRPYEIRW